MHLKMEFDIVFPQSLALSILTALVSVIFLLVRKRYTSICKRKLPPGEMGLPWIGETVEFFKAQRQNRLFENFVEPRMLKYGKVFKTRLMGSPTIVLIGAEANRFLLSNEFKLVVSSWPSSSVQLMGKQSIMTRQGEAHRFVRGIIATALSSAGLEAIVPRLCNTVQRHMQKNWYGQRKINLYYLTKSLTFNIVFECLLGIDIEEGMLSTFERVLEGVFAPPFRFPGSKFSRAKSARREIENMLVDVARRKRKEIEDRLGGGAEEEGMLLSRLVAAMIKGEVSEEEVVDNVVLLVFAAHDTTSFAIAMTFRMLAHHPNCYSLLLQEHLEVRNNKRAGENLTLEDTKKMKYTWQVVRESMRLFPPIFGSFRKAIVDIEYEGFTIPRGWKVLWTTYGTHYDAEYFEDPLIFNPRRFEEAAHQAHPYVFLPFGGGPRLCAGYKMAKLNILVFVHYVVTQYNWSLLHPEEPITMDPLPFPCHGMPINISPIFF